MLGSLGVYLAQFEAAAIATHVGLYRVDRVTTPVTGGGMTVSDYPKVTVYEGPGKIESYEPYEQALTTAGKTEVIQRYTWHVADAAGPFQIGDIVTSLGMPMLPNRGDYQSSFRIAGLLDKELKSVQRLLVDQVVKVPVTASSGGLGPPGQNGD